MQILVQTDDHICCDEELIRRIEGVIEGALERFSDHVTRVEVRLSDLDSHQLGDRDKRCTLEARVAGLKPVAATHEAVTLAEAIHDAAVKLKRSLTEQIRQLQQTAAREQGDPDGGGLFGAAGAAREAGDPVQ